MPPPVLFGVADDPKRDWPTLRAAERYRLFVYGRFDEQAGTGDAATSTNGGRIPSAPSSG